MNPYTGEPNEFDKALADFVNDVASGDAIRHLADQGMTVREYILGLPWPLTPVWHILDERMKRIMASGRGKVQAVIPEERRRSLRQD